MSEEKIAVGSGGTGINKPFAEGPTPGHWYGSEVAVHLCGGKVPSKSTPEAAGWDLYCPADVILPFRAISLVKLGIRTIIEPGYYFQIQGRSGLSLKGVTTRAGVIDSDYRDEWCVSVANESNADIVIHSGDRIAQAVFHKLPSVQFVELNSVDFEKSVLSNRGGGLGSTGK